MGTKDVSQQFLEVQDGRSETVKYQVACVAETKNFPVKDVTMP